MERSVDVGIQGLCGLCAVLCRQMEHTSSWSEAGGVGVCVMQRHSCRTCAATHATVEGKSGAASSTWEMGGACSCGGLRLLDDAHRRSVKARLSARLDSSRRRLDSPPSTPTVRPSVLVCLASRRCQVAARPTLSLSSHPSSVSTPPRSYLTRSSQVSHHRRRMEHPNLRRIGLGVSRTTDATNRGHGWQFGSGKEH